MAEPGMVGRRKSFRVVEAAGGDVDRGRRVAALVTQRASAGRAKAPGYQGRRTVFARASTRKLESFSGKRHPGHGGRCGCLAASLAVTDHAIRRHAGHSIPHRATKTSALENRCVHSRSPIIFAPPPVTRTSLSKFGPGSFRRDAWRECADIAPAGAWIAGQRALMRFNTSLLSCPAPLW